MHFRRLIQLLLFSSLLFMAGIGASGSYPAGNPGIPADALYGKKQLPHRDPEKISSVNLAPAPLVIPKKLGAGCPLVLIPATSLFSTTNHERPAITGKGHKNYLSHIFPFHHFW